MALPQRAAERVLDELKVAGPQDLQLLDLIAQARGATVVYKPLSGAEARLAVWGQEAVITVSSLIVDSHRQRFSVAHELGHFEMHRHRSRVMICTSQDIDSWGRQKPDAALEHEANEFAAALLLPERFFAPRCQDKDPSLDFVAHLANTFDVSLTATGIRYLTFCEEACALVFSQDGYIKWFYGSKEFRRQEIFIDVKAKLDSTTLAAAHFQNKFGQVSPKRVRASSWFEQGAYRDDATVLEQSWLMHKYNAVLTLLWIDQDIDDDNDFWLGRRH
ncbi:MAG: ImmA/IrrE family metallo-endopeptidase [Anaerolineae bacterium]|nr:ImmA/IrrE family metallo-endopeptidase [Anaerolineae bacterium]